MTESGATPSVDEGTPEPGETAPDPSWWHRSHPTFAGLVGFFTGVAFVIVVPGVYAALVPLALLIPRKTRRFAEFMLLGVVLTAVVVAGTAALVIWVLVKTQG
jgi:hypothetical protein